jgi:hypothetical protein
VRPPGDELFDLRPDEFVAARNALARNLRGEGDREAAATVAALRRPNTAAWALNQVARQEPELVARFLETSETLKAATEAALGGDADGLRAAQRDERASVDVVIAAARLRLAGLGERPSPAVDTRMVDTLRAAGTEPDAAALLRAGRLVTDLSRPGLGLGDLGFSYAAPVPPATPPARPGAADRRAARQAELEESAAAAEHEARELERHAAGARADAERADRVAASAEREARRARASAERARARAEAATSEDV